MTNNLDTIKVLVSSRIYIDNLPEEYKKKIRSKLTLPNPQYYKLMRSSNVSSRAVFATPKEFKYYYDNGGQFIIPRGLRTTLIKFLDDNKLKYELKESFVEKKADLKGDHKLTLRDYQEKIISDIGDKREGIIHATTGSGKTIVMLELAHKLGLTTTILVPNTLILRQVEREARNLFGLKPSIIGDKSKEIGSLTISTFQSLFNNQALLNQLIENTSILLIDEVHGIVSPEREKVIKQFKPKYLYGFSGTLDREDGKAKAINFYCGKIIAEYEMKFLKPTVEIYKTGVAISAESYSDAVEMMTINDSRNNLILGVALGEILAGRKLLILTKRIAHAKILDNRLPPSSQRYLIESSDKDRNTTLQILKEGIAEFDCIVGTTSLLSTGFDLPKLDTLIIACDMRSGILTKQSVGRILRLFDGKKQPKIIDIADNKSGFFAGQAVARKSIYRKAGWEITYETWDPSN